MVPKCPQYRGSIVHRCTYTVNPPNWSNRTDLESPVALRVGISLDLAGDEELCRGGSNGLGGHDQLLLLSVPLDHHVGCLAQVASGTGNELGL